MLCALIILAVSFGTITVEAQGSEVYIALGDSLAAGQTPNRAIDTGYTDLIAQKLTRTGQLAYYSKALAFPGYTTADVLARVQLDESKQLLKNATLVTISAGANDLLQTVQVDATSGSIAYKQITADFALNNVRKNIEQIIQEVQAIAPQAKIYVMGYYFAYPHVRASQKEGLKKELDRLQTILKTQSVANGATYVSVEESFGQGATTLLPNPADVHPTMEGYRVMANAFFSQYNNRLVVTQNELPAPNPLTFEQILNADKDQEKSPVSKSEGMVKYYSLTEMKPLI
ncbi:SGNH/GDSL hydrolase family protein [Psychrobacillus antarcticus]|uniref:SGNH/GDSL hydrolase family protein n=1 Tax=Psychrobacillus antarcticus TaxID=2879115 RepID=UPI00240776ED|nr:SGNH/GDSL hydrolase family protein [Psychrobacillus antarcticus]